jgi:hypothetical protein
MALLQRLEKEHRASLIDVSQVYRRLKQDIESQEEHTDAHESLGTAAPLISPSFTETWSSADTYTNSLVGEAREEIASIRSSLSRPSSFDSDTLQAQVTRYSRRLSQLMSEDQRRISQRWSAVLSYPQTQPPTDWAIEMLSDTQYTSIPQNDRSPTILLPPSPPSYSASSSPTQWVPQASQGSFGFPSPRSVDNQSSILSDTFYGIVRTWLMEKPLEDRRVILGSLMNEVCVTTPKSPRQADKPHLLQSPNAKTLNFHTPEDSSLVQSRQEAREINRRVREQVRKFEATKNTLGATGTQHATDLPGLTIDLSHQKIQKLPYEIIETIKSMVERLSLSRNYLVDLPQSIAMCERLRYLNLRNNQFPAIPAPVLNLPVLEILDISRNSLKALPETITKLRNLKVLAVQKNKISRLPYVLARMDKLRLLKWEGNPITFPSAAVMDAWMSVRPSPQLDKNSNGDEMDLHKTANLKKYLRTLDYSKLSMLHSIFRGSSAQHSPSGLPLMSHLGQLDTDNDAAQADLDIDESSKQPLTPRSARYPVVPAHAQRSFTTGKRDPEHFRRTKRDTMPLIVSQPELPVSLLEDIQSESDNEMLNQDTISIKTPSVHNNLTILTPTASKPVDISLQNTATVASVKNTPLLTPHRSPTPAALSLLQRSRSQTHRTRALSILSGAEDTVRRRRSHLDLPKSNSKAKRQSVMLDSSMYANLSAPLLGVEHDENYTLNLSKPELLISGSPPQDFGEPEDDAVSIDSSPSSPARPASDNWKRAATLHLPLAPE